MIINALDESTFEILIYDLVNLHDDYICGHLKIDRHEDEDSELKFWMFYPIGCRTPINAGDMKKISELISNLNRHDLIDSPNYSELGGYMMESHFVKLTQKDNEDK